ncbi:MAG: glycosyltransferase family 4 protein [Candidatus Pacebacteria bacterium]|nr:glycosyltransferase family 4 protein [Candidatus Paceibacterota bacterium]
MKKKILILSLAYYPNHVSGAEVAIKEVTDRFSPEDYEFHMVTLRYNSNVAKTEQVGNVCVHRIGITRKDPTFEDLGKMPLHINKPLFQFAAAWEALRLHLKYKFDGIWALMAHSSGVPAAIFKMCNPKVPFVLTLQEGDPPEQIEKTMKPLWPFFSRAFTKADVVQAVSTFLGDWALRRGFTGPLEIIPNGASISTDTEYDQAELDALAREVGKKEGEFVMVSVSRLVHQKAIDMNIKAVALLPENVRYVVVGDGPDMESLKALAQEEGVADRVVFMGRVDRSMTSKYRKIADVFVLPSRSEGLGISFLSTMAAGLPMVATQQGGIKDFLFDAQRNPDKPTTGWAVDIDSPEQIASAVQDIMEHPEQVERVLQNTKKMVEEQYNWETIAANMETKIFAKVLPE